jgi:hypothetical protein
VRSFTIGERRARLARRNFLTKEPQGDPVPAITAAMVGLHATDPATPYLSLWARTPSFTVDDLDRELYQRRSVVKHLAMRRTLWVVRAEDLPAIQPGASDRVAAGLSRMPRRPASRRTATHGLIGRVRPCFGIWRTTARPVPPRCAPRCLS